MRPLNGFEFLCRIVYDEVRKFLVELMLAAQSKILVVPKIPAHTVIF
jgi:hypothetical protein